jgi:hypothetical protein
MRNVILLLAMIVMGSFVFGGNQNRAEEASKKRTFAQYKQCIDKAVESGEKRYEAKRKCL